MFIQLKKGRDGPATLACVRADGTRTWGKEHPFFPVHDLTHCAVESVLGFDQAFFGLIAKGWDIDDFAKPRASRAAPLSVAEFNETVFASLPPVQRDAFQPLTDAQVSRVRELRSTLETRWHELPVGATLVVEFPAS